jgi:ABC-type multidrug transport system fused ATPase/permease subunit
MIEHTQISLTNLLKRFKWKISFTFILVILESVANLLFPLFMGFAIDGLLQSDFSGLINLAILGGVSVVLGASRKFYDTRAYASIYSTIAPEMVDKENKRNSSVSKINTRANLLTEFIEFFENFLPEIVRNFIGIIGALVIIFSLNFQVFIACLIVLFVIIAVYILTSKKIFGLNKSYNDQLEKQVDVLSEKDNHQIKSHFKSVMKWNIKLSDLESINFSIIWTAMVGLLIYSIVTVVDSGIVEYGAVFAILMYVFDYIENTANLPLYYQQLIRLHEITKRLQ